MKTISKKLALVLAATGIAIELITVALMSSGRLSTRGAVPLMVIGMFLAFLPLFTAAVNARKR